MTTWFLSIGLALLAYPAPVAEPGVSRELPTREEVEEFARRLNESFAEGDGSVLDEVLWYGALTHRVVLRAGVSRSFAKELQRDLEENMGLRETILEACGEDGSWRFLGTKTTSKGVLPVFRLMGDGGGVNYHELRLSKDSDGVVRLVDLFVYTKGAYLSHMLRFGKVPIDEDLGEWALEKLFSENLGFEGLRAARAADDLADEGRGEEALDVLAALPEAARNSRDCLATRLDVAATVSEEEFAAAFRDFERLFPNDTAVLVLRTDLLLQEGRHAEIPSALDRLQERVGLEDPYLDVLRAASYSAIGEHERARALVEAALLAEPSNRNAWYVLVDITNAAKDWRRLARNLTRSGEALGIELDPALSEDFDEFRATPEYRRWKKDRERAKRRH